MQHHNRWGRTVGLFLCCCNFTYKRKNFYYKDKKINVHFKLPDWTSYLFSTVHTNNEPLHSQGYDHLFLTPLSSHKCSLRLQLPSPAVTVPAPSVSRKVLHPEHQEQISTAAAVVVPALILHCIPAGAELAAASSARVSDARQVSTALMHLPLGIHGGRVSMSGTEIR